MWHLKDLCNGWEIIQAHYFLVRAILYKCKHGNNLQSLFELTGKKHQGILSFCLTIFSVSATKKSKELQLLHRVASATSQPLLKVKPKLTSPHMFPGMFSSQGDRLVEDDGQRSFMDERAEVTDDTIILPLCNIQHHRTGSLVQERLLNYWERLPSCKTILQLCLPYLESLPAKGLLTSKILTPQMVLHNLFRGQNVQDIVLLDPPLKQADGNKNCLQRKAGYTWGKAAERGKRHIYSWTLSDVESQPWKSTLWGTSHSVRTGDCKHSWSKSFSVKVVLSQFGMVLGIMPAKPIHHRIHTKHFCW